MSFNVLFLVYSFNNTTLHLFMILMYFGTKHFDRSFAAVHGILKILFGIITAKCTGGIGEHVGEFASKSVTKN